MLVPTVLAPLPGLYGVIGGLIGELGAPLEIELAWKQWQSKLRQLTFRMGWQCLGQCQWGRRYQADLEHLAAEERWEILGHLEQLASRVAEEC